jgi:hypothetical protein
VLAGRVVPVGELRSAGTSDVPEEVVIVEDGKRSWVILELLLCVIDMIIDEDLKLEEVPEEGCSFEGVAEVWRDETWFALEVCALVADRERDGVPEATVLHEFKHVKIGIGVRSEPTYNVAVWALVSNTQKLEVVS